MSETKIIDYTQIPNLRVIKNRDFKTPPGERSTMNIGLGLPSFVHAELPSSSISKSGDMAFDSSLQDLTFFIEGVGWIPVSQDSIPKAYAGFKSTTVSAAHQYLLDAPTKIVMGAESELINNAKGLTTPGDATITNSTLAPMNLLVNASISLLTTDAAATNLLMAFRTTAGGEQGASNFNLSAINSPFSISLTTLLTLNAGDKIILTLNAVNIASTIQCLHLELNALQI